MKSFFYIVTAAILIILILPGCSDDILKPPPPLDPEMFADISGYDSLHFESPVSIYQIPQPVGYQLFLNGSSTVKGKQYGLSISLIYLNTEPKPGTFKFRSFPDTTKDFAVGGLIVGKGENEVKFISDSGTVVITELIGTSVINGTFNFYGSDTSKTKYIKVENGILKIK